MDGNKLPPSVTVLRNSDGSMSIVSTSGADPLANTKLPKNSVTNADGSTSIAAGSVIQENPDGTVTVDGVPLPPGTAVKKLSDGSAVLFQSPLASTKLPGSAKVNSDGTATINASAIVKENADGTIVVDGVLLPKGTGVKKMPDGSMVTFEKPKLKKVPGKATTPQMKTNTDGSVSLGNVKLPAGTTSGKDGSISLPTGTSVTRSADGTVMVDGKPLPAGIGAKVNPDGSVSLAPTTTLPPVPKVQTSPDGSLSVGSVKLPQGSKPNVDGSIALPAGSRVSKSKDGSVTIDGQKLPPGTTVKTNADGSMSLVSSLPPTPNVTTNLDGSLKFGDVSLPKTAKPSFDGSVTLEKGTAVVRGNNGRITLDGQELPAGTELRTNPDGSLSILPPVALTGLVNCHHFGDLVSDGLLHTSDHHEAPNSLSPTFCEPDTNHEDGSPDAKKDTHTSGSRLLSDMSPACLPIDSTTSKNSLLDSPQSLSDLVPPLPRISGEGANSTLTSSNRVASGAATSLGARSLSNTSNLEFISDKQFSPQEHKSSMFKSNTKQHTSIREDQKQTHGERGSTKMEGEPQFFEIQTFVD